MQFVMQSIYFSISLVNDFIRIERSARIFFVSRINRRKSTIKQIRNKIRTLRWPLAIMRFSQVEHSARNETTFDLLRGILHQEVGKREESRN